MPISPTLITCIEIQMHGVVVAGGSNAKTSVSTWHYRRTTNTNPLSKANIESGFNGATTTAILAALNARYTQAFNTVRFVDDALDAPSQVTRAGVGAISGESLTTAESAYLLYRTGLRGKSYRGSKKLFPFSESDTTLATADLWNAGALTRLAAINTAFLAGFTDSDGNVWKACVLSRKLSTLATNPTTVVINDITTALVNKRVGTMKKRKVVSVY